MLWTVLLCALAGAPQKKDPSKIEYPGPLGLKWGQSPAEVKDALSKRFEFSREGPTDNGAAFTMNFDGQFAGFETDGIEALFMNDRLVGLSVILARGDTVLPSVRWQKIVNQMTEAYGPPTKTNPTPRMPSFSDVVAKSKTAKKDLKDSAASLDGVFGLVKQEWIEDQIRTGAWEPLARWRFKNGIVGMTAVRLDPPDEEGKRTLFVIWTFFDEQKVKTGFASTPRDF